MKGLNLQFSGAAYFYHPSKNGTERRIETRKELKIFQFIFFRKSRDTKKRIVDLFCICHCRIIARRVCFHMRVCVCAHCVTAKGEGRRGKHTKQKRRRKISTLDRRIIYMLAQDVNIINI